MANSPKITAAVANAMLDAGFGGLNNGTIEIYDGVQPANCGDPITTQVKLVTLGLNSAAFQAASGAAKAANGITPGLAIATSTATWFRMKTSGGTVVLDGSVGISGCDLNLTSVTINSGDTIAITSGSISHPLL